MAMIGEDVNSYFYTFSTMAQVLGAVIAITAVFVFAKGSDYKSKMQREMGNVVRGFDALIQGAKATRGGKPLHPPESVRAFEDWRRQATSAERHGVYTEMRVIFAEHSQRSLGSDIRAACDNGLKNATLNARMVQKFRRVFNYGILLIGMDFLLLGLTSGCLIGEYRMPAFVGLMVMIIAACGFLFLTARLVHSTVDEE